VKSAQHYYIIRGYYTTQSLNQINVDVGVGTVHTFSARVRREWLWNVSRILSTPILSVDELVKWYAGSTSVKAVRIRARAQSFPHIVIHQQAEITA
jgi:hypothetical protein